MKKLVMAALLATAAMAGPLESAGAMQLVTPPMSVPQHQAPAISQTAPVQLAQAGDPAMRVLQLEEQIRSLNGRIEEMSFQLLQMQEQMRKTQEDNEFRFQELEKKSSGTRKSGGLEAPVEAGQRQDSVAQIITDQPAAPQPQGTGAPEQQLGSIQLDAKGMPTTATINDPSKDGSALPGVDTGVATPVPAAPPAAASPADPVPQIASLDSEQDVYQSAYGHVLSGDYGIAEAEFRDFIQRYPNSGKIADANFWLGEAQYSQANYNEAAKTFLNGHQAYASSAKAPEMLLKLGMSLAALDNKDTACATMREVSKRYPKASRAVISKTASEMKRLAC